ncbi:MAG: hypothetical protein IPP40_04800 [bacterium]|nr:hypothetical protein [bacterium]
MPFPGNAWTNARMIPWQELLQRLREKHDLLPLDNSSTDVARSFAIEGHCGTVIFISALSDEFVQVAIDSVLRRTDRLSPASLCPAEVSLRDIMRTAATDEELLQVIHGALQRKHFAHLQAEGLVQLDNRCMSAIGG